MYKVFDLETTIDKKYNRKANPFLPSNWVVARGWKNHGDSHNSWTYHPTLDRTTYLHIEPGIKLLVGFNIKFDITYEMVQGNKDLHEFYKRGGKIWDCQYVEYLLRGQVQEVQMVALDDIIESYGGKLKIDAVKALWEQGVNTDDIPEDLLIDYLVGTEAEGRNGGDIRNTELIFLGQIKKARELGMIKMIEDRMDGLLATIDMEFRGIKVDVPTAISNMKELLALKEIAEVELAAFIPKDLPPEINFRWTRHQTSAILFGGTLKYQRRLPYLNEVGELSRLKAYEQWPLIEGAPVCATDCTLHEGYYIRTMDGASQDVFLSGKRKGEAKFRKVEVQGEIKKRYTDQFYKFNQITEPDEDWAGAELDGAGRPVYSTDKDTMEELFLRADDIPFIRALASKTKLDKEIGTYYYTKDEKTGEMTGMLTLVQSWDHFVHHRINHTVTITGRTSSSDPNMQNLPRGDKSKVKQMFVSRFDQGLMIEADYSQLEVVVQGVLSNDVNLRRDLNAGTDFHCKRVSLKYGVSYQEAVQYCKDENYQDFLLWKARRNAMKIFSFQLAYGAGAAKLSMYTKLPIDDIKELMEIEDREYPGVKALFGRVQASVFETAEPFNAVGKDGQWHKYRRGYWTSPTGTRYSFRSYDAPEWSRKKGATDSFMPTELKNYPIQGTGGEFVQGVALGRVWRECFIATDYYGWRAYLVNTVHDCIWCDTDPSVTALVGADVKRVMESIPAFYNARYGMSIDVPFPVEVEAGLNMYELKHLH